MASFDQKLRTLYLMEILLERTDDEHMVQHSQFSGRFLQFIEKSQCFFLRKVAVQRLYNLVVSDRYRPELGLSLIHISTVPSLA